MSRSPAFPIDEFMWVAGLICMFVGLGFSTRTMRELQQLGRKQYQALAAKNLDRNRTRIFWFIIGLGLYLGLGSAAAIFLGGHWFRLAFIVSCPSLVTAIAVITLFLVSPPEVTTAYVRSIRICIFLMAGALWLITAGVLTGHWSSFC